ncbi:MAG: putative toxin-antitoxin system toxin component, PIN family [Oscillatoriales cyanobacterium CG2_30_40_61]|nr:MAG: putative toxin-antitoxin system toxin component, PIN family [Oscillatoriales cyanobacterium CG2_30_40_61]
MKVVLDTNIFISGWLWDGRPDQILKLGEIGEINVCASEELLTELAITLSQKKFKLKLQTWGFEVHNLMDGIRNSVEIYSISKQYFPELRDPNDWIILATAIASQADSIITGDRDLLTLENYENIPILTARDFLNIYFP